MDNFPLLELTPMTSIEDDLADIYLLPSQRSSNSLPTMDGSNNFVDPDEVLVDADNEKDSVININTDSDGEPALRADDFEAMRKAILTPLPELPPILADGHHTWEIKNWRQLARREHGPVFEVGGFPWRILMFPFGNNVDHTSFYLEQGFPDGKAPDDFVCCVQFGLVLWNPNSPDIFTHHVAHHRFTKEEGDWGFTRFVEIRKLWQIPFEGTNRFLVEHESANITAYVRVVKDETGVLWHNFQNYDSKKETGFVGLKNQGATCYLNSLIQSLYFTNAFRKAVYQIPTQGEDSLQNSAYTLQRLFYQLQTSNNAVSTNELTKSFGWETRHIFEQQDVQELSRKLMERMEEKMKGTESENVLPRLFCGKVRTYISCINVEYESRRVEDFWDIQLNVSGNKTIEDSFRDYIQVETMDGENQYFAGDQFKLQDARKGVIFESFPEVLHLQLKRFQYDIDHDAMMKINDLYEFPESFDAAPYLSSDADRSEPWIYKLHGVLVHSGDLNAGHYYAFIKPGKDGWFYKYDDDKVTKATMREVLNDNYGGEYPMGTLPISKLSTPTMRQMSAYMLVYIRESRLDDVLCPVGQEDTPSHLQAKLDEEAALREARRKEREEQHLYMGVRVITEDTYLAHGGTDLTTFDVNSLDEPSAAKSYRVLRKSTLRDLILQIAEDTGVNPNMLRLWCMVNRQNKTTRPDVPLTDLDATVEEAHQKLVGSKTAELRLWAEMAEQVGEDGLGKWPTNSTTSTTTSSIGSLTTLGSMGSMGSMGSSTTSKKLGPDQILLFLKWFDVENQRLRGAGHIYISHDKRVEELVPVILNKMDWPEKLPSGDRLALKLYEEIKPTMIEPMKGKQTLKAAELQDGDIICFQKSTSGLSTSDLESQSQIFRMSESDRSSDKPSTTNSVYSFSDRIEFAPMFYDFLIHKREVQFHPHPTRNPNPEAYEPFSLTLSAKHSYDQVSTKVGDRLGVDPTHLRFWSVNATTGNPKSVIKRNQTHTLQLMLNPPYSTFSNNNQKADQLYFEVLEMSLTELDTKKSLRVQWLSEGLSKVDTYDILVAKSGTVDDLILGLVKKLNLTDQDQIEAIRIYEIHSHKIQKELGRSHAVISITDYVTLSAEIMPEFDRDIPSDQFIYAFHFQNEPNKGHGIPFKFRMIEGEQFINTRKRLETRLGLKGKNFEKIKFAVVTKSQYSKPKYLADEDVLWDMAVNEEDLLGLDHVDRTRIIRNGAGDLFLK